MKEIAAMNVDQLKGSHVGCLVALKQADGPVSVELVGPLTSYELHWTNGHVVYAWLIIGGKEHVLANAAEVARTHLEIRP